MGMVTYRFVADSITIAGVGAVSPFGDSTEAFRDALLEGRSGITPVASFGAEGCRSTLAARVNGFDAAKWIAPMKLRRMDATGPLALVMAQQALSQARYAVTADGDERTGVVLGTYSAGGHATSDYLSAFFEGGPSNAPALLFNSTVGNAATGLTGLEYRLRGPNATVSHKEASGLGAVVTAVDLLRQGHAEAIVAGGVDSIYEFFFKAHDQFRVMNDAAAFDGTMAPFSRTRRGFVLGEGAYGLWLERASPSGSRETPALGEILGVGAASASVRLNAWPDRPEPLVRTMRMALDDARMDAADVDVVYASANGSPALDRVEALALVELFGDSDTVITAIKGAIGESGASGAASCVAALLCGASGRVPPIAGLVEPDPATQPLRLARAAVDGPARVALVNSVASGGALFSVVLRCASM